MAASAFGSTPADLLAEDGAHLLSPPTRTEIGMRLGFHAQLHGLEQLADSTGNSGLASRMHGNFDCQAPRFSDGSSTILPPSERERRDIRSERSCSKLLFSGPSGVKPPLTAPGGLLR